MAIAVPNVVKAVGSGVTSVTTSGVTTTTGSTFLIICSCGAGATMTPSDSKGNTYTLVDNQGASGTQISCWYKTNGAGGAGHTAAVNLSAAEYPVLHFIELSGADATSLDATSVNSAAASGPYSLTSGTLAQADSLVVAWASSDSPGAQNYAASGYTVNRETDGDNYWTSANGYKQAGSTSAQSSTWTGIGGSVAMGIAAFKAAAGGTGYELSVDPATYALTAAAETAQVARALTVSPAGYAMTAQPVNLAVGRSLSVSPASYALNAAGETLAATRALSIDPASYSLANRAVTLSVGRAVSDAATSYALTASPVSLVAGRGLSIDAAVYALSAPDVTLVYRSANPVLVVDPVAYVLRLPDVELELSGRMAQEEVSYPGPSRKKKPRHKWSGVPFTRIYPEVEQIGVIEQAAETAAQLPEPPTRKRAVSYLHEYGIYQDHLAKVLIEIERVKREQRLEREDDEVAAVIACCL